MGFWENRIIKQIYNNIGNPKSIIRLPHAYTCLIENDEYSDSPQQMLTIYCIKPFRVNLVYRNLNWFIVLTRGISPKEVPIEEREWFKLESTMKNVADEVTDELRYVVYSLDERYKDK